MTDHQSGGRFLGPVGLFALLLFLVPFLQFAALIPCVTDVLSAILFTECAFLFCASAIGVVVVFVLHELGRPGRLLRFVGRFSSGAVGLEVEEMVVNIFPSSLVLAPQVVNDVVH